MYFRKLGLSKTLTSSNLVGSSQSNVLMDQEAITQLVAQQIAAILPGIIQQVQANAAPANAPTNPPACTYKNFKSCGPLPFDGLQGATALLQWIESIQNTFRHSKCADEQRVEFATSVFQKRALTWWSTIERTRTPEVALALPWDDVKALMVKEFCPTSELQNLRDEFWNLKQISGDDASYVNRFHELCQLLPRMVETVPETIEKFCQGLPIQTQGIVIGSKPATLAEAVEMNSTLTANLVRAGVLTRKNENNTSSSKLNAATSSQDKKRKCRNQATVAAVPITAVPVNQVPPEGGNPNKKPYAGNYPLCNACKYHHPTNLPCRICNTCGKAGHLTEYCWSNQTANQFNNANRNTVQNNQAPQFLIQGGACFNCGNPGHMRNACPHLVTRQQQRQQPPQQQQVPQQQIVPAARGRVYNINTDQAQVQADDNAVNDAYHVNDN